MADHLPAVHPCTWANIEDIIGFADCFFVVFNHDHCVALIPQILERQQEAIVVTLMQSDRRLIQHVKHARET